LARVAPRDAEQASAMAEEIELKLTAPPDAIAAVRAHPAVSAAKRGPMRTTQMVSTYYDTPQRELAAAGVALRVRKAGRHWLQTVKGDGAAVAGLHRRAEYEWRLNAPGVDTTKLAATPWRKLFAQHTGRWRPLFATTVRRSAQPLAFPDGTRATLCLDVGEIRAGRRQVPLTEIELELGEGDPTRLFELASALVTDLPARVTVTSKTSRGYALATQAPAMPRRAQEVPFDPDITVGMALARIGAECLAQVEANAEAMLASDDPEFLHQLRVGWRRLRSLLKLTALVSPPEKLAPIEQELHWVGSVLGPARDYDVFATETLPAVAVHFRGQREIVRLRARVARRRHHLRDAARELLASARFQQLLLALGAFLIALEKSAPAETTATLARDWVRPLLDERDRKLRKRTRHVQRLASSERHRARVAAKKLRYAAEFFSPLFPGKRADEYVTALSKLQGALGRLNDLTVAARLLEETIPAADPPALAHAVGIVRGWLAGSTGPELKRLRAARRRFARCSPFWE
jgi:inorganic triphosphatase YgiF